MGLKLVAESSRHAGAIWRDRLSSALRTALACTIIGCTALYGPNSVRHQIQYPSVAYVTAILIVSDATLGTTLRGSWHALCATVLVVPSAVVCLSIVGPSKFTVAGAAFAVGLSAFMVALPECLSVLTKRIAFVQMVIIYVGVVVRGRTAGPVTHPVHIAACTALGASASVAALVLPYPRLAVKEVKKHFQSYVENASERSRLYLKAFLSENKSIVDDLISQAEPVAQSGTNLLHHIHRIQEGVSWEMQRFQDSKTMEPPIKGMRMALSTISDFPLAISHELRTVLQSSQVNQLLKLDNSNHFTPFDDEITSPESKDELFDEPLHTLIDISPTRKNLPVFFFLSCLEQLVNSSNINPKPKTLNQQQHQKFKIYIPKESILKERLVFALKCSISLGLGVFLGMIFDQKNGYWSGLTIAISIVEGRLPVFTVASNRVHGTAIGSVYAVLGSSLFHQVIDQARFFILLPWVIFTSLLQHSQMFGESGGISAVIGALLILGRKNYGPTKQFAIARLTEVSIGLFCMVLIEILLQPVRAASVARLQVSRCLQTLDECLNHVPNAKDHIKKLKSDLNRLNNLINHVKSEPSFWFLPFKGSCYDNTKERLSNMVDLMEIMSYNMECISRLSQISDYGCKELQEHINGNLELLKESTSPCVKFLQKITFVNCNDEGFVDLELGSQPEEAALKYMDGFVEKLKGFMGKIQTEEECKRKVFFHLNSLGFCMGSLVGETMQVEKCIKEIIRYENQKV